MQDISSVDFGEINVDDISDDQIKQIMEAAEQNGYTIEQIEAAAIVRGMSQSEVQKLRLRINSIQTVGTSGSGQKREGNTREETQTAKRQDLKPDDIIAPLFEGFTDSTDIKDPRKEVFGYSLFNTRDLTFEPSVNVPTPENYILGPGDELVIDIWGASQQNYQLTVSPDGYVFIDNIGRVNVSGLKLDEASEVIKRRLSAIFAGMRSPGSNTFAEVSLGRLRSIKVVLLGDVYLPGSYTLSSLSTAFNALYLSGGPDINGSLRNIEIIRNSRIIDTIDVYDFLFKGDATGNVHLQDQDIIKVNPYSIRVKLNGEVKKPMVYEMKPDESVSDLLSFAGGMSDKAYVSGLRVIRSNGRENEIIDLTTDDYGSFTFQNGDSIIIDPILDRFANRVEIRGAVYRPGEYSIGDGLTLKQLVEKAEGLKGDAFMSRALIYRTMDNYMLEIIPVDLTALMNDNLSDIQLKREDIVSVPSVFDLKEEYYVQIDGEVRNPGKYPFMYNSTVEDLIIQAGGFLESASLAQIEIARRVRNADASIMSEKVADIFNYPVSKDLQISEEAKKLTLEPFDRIFVRQSPGYEIQLTAKIEGEVFFPGEYSISNKDERISDLLRRSGGLTQYAYPEGASLIRRFEIPERERTKLLQQSEIFRLNLFGSLDEQQTNTNNNNNIQNPSNWDTEKIMLLDSILNSAIQYNYEQNIGINLERIIKNPRSKYDLIIQEGDRLVIPKLLQTVSLSGELLHPSSARYDKRSSFRDYIRSAGGFTSMANKSKSYIIYANGSIDNTRNFLGLKKYPRIEPGAEIVVPLRERRTLAAGEIVSLGSALTSMALFIVTLINSF